MVGYGSFLSNFDILFAMNVMWPLISDFTSPEALFVNSNKTMNISSKIIKLLTHKKYIILCYLIPKHQQHYVPIV